MIKLDKLVTIEDSKPVFRGRTISQSKAGYSYILIPRSVVKHLNTNKVDFVLQDDGSVLMRPHQ